MEDCLPLAEVEAWEVAVAGVAVAVADVDVFVVVVAAAAAAADAADADAVERGEVVALEVWTKLELRCCYGQEVALATN